MPFNFLYCILVFAIASQAAPTNKEILEGSKGPIYDITYQDDEDVPSEETPIEATDKQAFGVEKVMQIKPREYDLFQCSFDEHDTEYCEAALAQCGQYFDYEEGYSVEGVGSVVDYADKVLIEEYAEKEEEQVIIGTRDGSYAQWNNTSSASRRAYVMWVDGECWNGWKPWKDFDAYASWFFEGFDPYYKKVSNSKCEQWLGPYYKYGIEYKCPANYSDDGDTDLCVRTFMACPDNYTETNDPQGECKRTIKYTYYDYKCNNNTNDQGYDYEVTDSGGDCDKADPDTTSTNESSLDDSCNSETPPDDNCKREKFLCEANEDRPCAWVDDQWQCSPFGCTSDHQCGTAKCNDPLLPSSSTFMSDTLLPFEPENNGAQCTTKNCDISLYEDFSYCTKEGCPKGFGVYEQDGECYVDMCPHGTYETQDGKCLKE